MRAVGVVTIGQAPRPDIGTAFARHFAGTGFEILQAGALDGLAEEDIRAGFAPAGGEVTYVTRLLSGRSVELAKSGIVPLLQARIDELESRCEAIVIVCTGDFPMLAARAELFFPDRILLDAAAERGVAHRLGLVVPLAAQAESIAGKWKPLGVAVHTAAASPYADSDVAGAAAELAREGAELIVLDCMGFTPEHGAAARQAVGCEVIVPQDFVPRYMAGRLTGKR